MPSELENTDRRDAGMTLIEVLVTMGLLGLVSAVVVGAVTVVFRTESGVTNTVAQAHDVQQAVNYFHLDVQSGPALAGQYRASTSADRGSGCSDVGSDNVFRYDAGDRRIAYRLSMSGTVGELDRYECSFNGSSYDEVAVVNIADLLDASSGTPVSVSLATRTNVDSEVVVDRVTMSFAQTITDREISAAPNAELGLDAPSLGVCTDDPLAAAENFDTFVEDDVHLTGSPKRSLAVGGALSWDGNLAVGQNMNTSTEFPVSTGLSNAALLAGSVDWSSVVGNNSNLTVHSGADAAFGDFSDSDVSSQGQNRTVFELGDGNQKPAIKVQNGGAVIQNVSPIDFAAAFVELRACSDLLASMPSGCSCAEFVDLLNVNGNTYEGTANNDSVKLVLQPGTVNVLNLSEQHLDDLHDIKWDAQAPSATSPLIVNVASGADMTFTPPQIQGAGSTASYILWNFPNVTGTLTVSGGGGDGVWGTIFAPYADVVADVKIEGGVIAKSFTFTGTTINPSRSFEGLIPWD